MGIRQHWLLALVFLTILLVIRLGWLYATQFSLSPDEAQYWYWSKNLAWGYYSKPPAVAFIIWLGTSILGNSEAAIRVFSPVLYFLSSIIIYKIGKELYNCRTGMWCALIFSTTPGVSFSCALMSTDPILVFIWSLSLYLFIVALKTNLWKYWLALGLTTGLGMLTKYNMLIFLPSALIFLLSSSSEKPVLRTTRFWFALLLAFLVWLPNLIWNYQYGFPNFLHTRDLAGVGSQNLFNIEGLANFFFAQFAVFGPISFAGTLGIAIIIINKLKTVEQKLLLSFAAPFLLIICAVAFKDHAHANWAAPAYVAATILFCAYILEAKKESLLKLTFGFNIVLLVIGLSSPYLHSHYGLTLNPRIDQTARLEFGRVIGDRVKVISKEHPGSIIAANDRKILAWLLYYTKPEIYKWNPTPHIKDHFDLTANVKNQVGKKIILVSLNRPIEEAKEFANSITLVDTLQYRKGQEIKIIILDKYTGY